ILWKKISPPSKMTSTAALDASKLIAGACPWPVSAHRNPSITPAIGFNPYNHRQRAGTSELGYATGEANIQNCSKNGVTYRTSRYSAFNADSHSPTPGAVATASKRKSGNRSEEAAGLNP